MESIPRAKRSRVDEGGTGEFDAPLTLSALNTPAQPSSTATPASSTRPPFILGSSFLASSGLAPTCSVASHGRLESVLRQTELLRRLDADAHEAVTSELNAQIDKLRQDVEALSKALQSAQSMLSTQQEATGQVAAHAQKIAKLTTNLAQMTAERDAMAAQADEVGRRLTAASQAQVDGEAAHKRAVGRYEEEIAALTNQLLEARSTAAAAGARAAIATAAALPTSSPFKGSGDGGYEAMELRESLRAEQRRSRQQGEEAARWREEAQGAVLAHEQLRAVEARASRLETAAAQAGRLRRWLEQTCALIARYEASVGASRHAAASELTAADLPRLVDSGREAADVVSAISSAFNSSGAIVDSLASRVGAFKSEAARAQQRLSEAGLKLTTALEARDTALADASAARQELVAATQAVSDATAAKLRAEARANLSSASAASLHSLLATYDAEDKAFGAQAQQQAAGVASGKARSITTASYRARSAADKPAAAPAPPNPLAGRVGALEKLLAQAQGDNAALVEALEHAPLPGAVDALNARLASLSAELRACRAEADVLYRHFAPVLQQQGALGEGGDGTESGACCSCGGLSGVATGVPFTIDDTVGAASGLSDAGGQAAASRSGMLVDEGAEEKEAPAMASPNATAVKDSASLRQVRILHSLANPTSAALRVHDVAQREALAAAKAELEAVRCAAAAVESELRKQQLRAVTAEDAPAASSTAATAASAPPVATSSLGVSSLASSGIGFAGNATFVGSVGSQAAEIDKLRKRMKDAFQAGFTRYRNAVMELTGYKIDMPAAFASTQPTSDVSVVARSLYAGE